MFINSFLNGFARGFGFGMFSSNPFLFGGFSPFFGNPFLFSNFSMCMYPSVFSTPFYPLFPPISPPPMIFPTFKQSPQSLNFSTNVSASLNYSDIEFPDLFKDVKLFPDIQKSTSKDEEKKTEEKTTKPEVKQNTEAEAEIETETAEENKTKIKRSSQAQTVTETAAKTKTDTRAASEAQVLTNRGTQVTPKPPADNNSAKAKTDTRAASEAQVPTNRGTQVTTRQPAENNAAKSKSTNTPQAATVVTSSALGNSSTVQKNEDKKTKKKHPNVGASIGDAFKKIIPHKKSKKQNTNETLNMCATSDKPGQTKFDNLILKYANKFNVDPLLVKSVMKQESRFNPNAVSYCGAKGLMQLMPGTAKEMGVKNIFDPEDNIKGGVKYLKKLLDKFRGDTRLAVAAYNAGPNRSCYARGEIPNITQTRNYVRNVLGYYCEYQSLNA